MERDKPKFIIGVDPDVEKNGIALLDTEEKSFGLIRALSFSNVIPLLGEIHATAEAFDEKVVMVLEDSDSTTNWHLKSLAESKMKLESKLRKAAAIGHGSGMCHATQRHLEEIAKTLGIEVVKVKPLKKTWLGKDGKITHEELAQFVPDLPETTNQEGRDAALLAWCYAKLPIHIPADFYNNYWKMNEIGKRAQKEMREAMDKTTAHNLRVLHNITKSDKK